MEIVKYRTILPDVPWKYEVPLRQKGVAMELYLWAAFLLGLWSPVIKNGWLRLVVVGCLYAMLAYFFAQANTACGG
jgi:hypothetical protein